jgi:hypothetical protein
VQEVRDDVDTILAEAKAVLSQTDWAAAQVAGEEMDLETAVVRLQSLIQNQHLKGVGN